MRNLKKLFAVILTVAMIASMMVPALAANTYSEEALKLQAINVFAGGPEDLKLDEGVTRIQGLTFAIRAAGKDADALAMDAEEVDAILADWTDAASIPAWGRAYAAYAIENGITVGLSTTEKIFGAMNPISGTSFLVFIMRSGMGYDVTTANVIDDAVDAGILTPGQAVTFGAKAALIRDDAAGILYGAFTTGVNADGTKLIDAYIESGATSYEDALAAGFVEEVVPEDLEVVSVTANNLKEMVLVFNKNVDGDTVKKDNIKMKKGNSTFSAYDVSLKDDKVTVVIKATGDGSFDNQTDYTVTIKDVKDADGNKIEETAIAVTPFDAELPAVTDITVTGPKNFEIKFSEPIKNAGTRSISVKSGTTTVGVNNTFVGYNSDTIKVTLYSGLVDGKTYTITIKGFEDFAEYKMINYTADIDYVADKSDIVATIEKAEQTYVVVKFNKPVIFGSTPRDFFYHTFSAWKPLVNGVYSNEEMTVPVAQNNPAVDKVWVKFADGTDGYPIREGESTLVIREKANDKKIKDNWDNEFLGATLTLEVTADKTPPSVSELKVESETSLKVKFDENVKFTKDNVEVLNADGTKNKDIKISVTGSGKEYIINLGKNMAGKSILVTLKNVEDTALSPNKLVSYTETIDVTDKTAPDVSKVTVKDTADEQALYVFFNEDMGESALSKDNYLFKPVTGAWKKVANTPEFYDGNKVVRIELTDDEVEYLSDYESFVIMNVKDVSDNTMIAKVFAVGTIVDYADDDNKPTVKEAKATAIDTLELTFDQYLTKVDAEAFEINGAAVSGMAVSEDDDGNTVITLTVGENKEIAYDAKSANAYNVDGTKLENIFGVQAKTSTQADKAIDDKIAPEIIEDGITTFDADGNGKIDHIKITFEEAMKYIYVGPSNFEVDDYDVLDAYAVSAGAPDAATGRTGATVADGKVIYVSVKEKDSADFAATPDVKIKGVLKDLADNDYDVEDDALESIDGIASKVLTATENTDAKVITITFTEELDAATVIASAFTGSAGTPTVSYVAGSKTVTLTYGTALADTNTIIVGASIKDKAGNTITSATFTRGSEAAGAGVYTKS